MQELSNDYRDDILSSEMNGKRRYNMIHNDDGTVSFEDVTEYDQTGDDFNAGLINAITSNINELISVSQTKSLIDVLSASFTVPNNNEYVEATVSIAVPEGTKEVVPIMMSTQGEPIFVHTPSSFPLGTIKDNNFTLTLAFNSKDAKSSTDVDYIFLCIGTNY